MNQDQLKSILYYHQDSGVFYWRISSNMRIKPWDTAGKFDSDGYLQIRFAGKDYKAHRLAWLYVNGEFPNCQIDHINGIRKDNRICNLRTATIKQNAENRRISKKNTSGFRGVTLQKRTGKWQAQMTHNGKMLYLGLHSTPEEASAVVSAKRAELYTHYVETEKPC